MKIAKYYQKTLFGMFAIMGVIVASISVLYVNTVDRELTGNFLKDSKAIARSIADSNVDLIVSQNYSALQSIIDQFVDVGGISYVFVVNQTGTIIAHTFVPGVPKEIAADYKTGRPVYDRQIKGMGHFTEVTANVLGGEAGQVHVGMDNGYIALQVQTAIGKQVYLLSIIFVLAVLVSYGLMYQVSHPLNHLGQYVRHAVFAAGEVEPPHPDRVDRLMLRTDEIGELARLFRALIHRLS